MDAVLGTAGHIDHGKTSLVRALTGINCDRLEEEKRRGITIELGFAWLDLPDGRRLGIVDVPGHERFVKNMVAGAAGIDSMLLVIAADEGIMPQTREHLDICTLLGVKKGIIALTKTDLVDAEWLDLVLEDIKNGLKGTFLESAPIYPVSSFTGEGIETLRKGLFSMIASLKPKTGTDILRLPVDRVFTLKGFGTVVTGTLVSGQCAQGEELALLPKGEKAKARTIQVHGNQTEEAHRGQRCAMNLQGIEVEQIERGDVISHPGFLFPSTRWIVNLSCLPDTPLPIKQRMEIHFHHGARECLARVVFKDRNELAPGHTALAEIHFKEPMVGIFGDHCVLRAHSPLRTIGGGQLVDPLPPVLRRRDAEFTEKMAALEALANLAASNEETISAEDADNLVLNSLKLVAAPGTDERHLAVLTALPDKLLRKTMARLEKAGKIVCWDAASHSYTAQPVFNDSLEHAVQRAAELHGRDPLKASFALSALFSGWGETLPQKYMQKVADEGLHRGILAMEANGVKLASHKVILADDQENMQAQLMELYANGGLTPPTLKEVVEQLQTDQKRLLPILAHLCTVGKLVKIQEGFYFETETFETMKLKILEWFSRQDNLDIADMKTLFGFSRKFAIPVLEYLDSIKITYRSGNRRCLSGQNASQGAR